MEKKVPPRPSRLHEADGKSQHSKYSHGCRLCAPGKPIPVHSAAWRSFCPSFCPGSMDNWAAIFKLAFSFPLQRCLNGFPLAHGSTGSTDVVSHCDGKGYRVQNKSEIICWHSWDQNSRLLSSTDVITGEGRLWTEAAPLRSSRTSPAASQHPGWL